MICLNRFLVGEKNQSLIGFPDVWQLGEVANGLSRDYALQAHVTHFGETVDSGKCLCYNVIFAAKA